jgi:Cu-Zn family superoxide dismutase
MSAATKTVQVGAAAILAVAFAMPGFAAELANAKLRDADGKAVGDVDLMQTPAGVLLRVRLNGLPPGEHAFHIHEVGKCEQPFTSAGGHYNPGKHPHGYQAGEGHAGDMPNLHVPQDGSLAVEILNAKVTLDDGKPHSLFDSEGSSIVIHAKADDYRSQPAGDAGGRIACGVIERSAGGGAAK